VATNGSPEGRGVTTASLYPCPMLHEFVEKFALGRRPKVL
jgi:hypothetical protein